MLLACAIGMNSVGPGKDPTAEPGGNPDTAEDTAAEPDGVSTALTATSDFCAWDRGEHAEAEPLTPPEGYIESPHEWPFQPCLDGRFLIHTSAGEIPTEGYVEYTSAHATFFSISEPEVHWTAGEWLDPEEGVDDCGYVSLSSNGLYRPSDLAWLDPGAVDLFTPSTTVPMGRSEAGWALNWDAEELDGPEYGGTYGLSIAGSAGGPEWDAFAAMELPDLVELPGELTLTSPTLSPGMELARADTELTWTGSSDGLITVFIYAEDAEDNDFLRCSVTDDGAFTLPGEILAYFPADAEINLSITRRNDVWVGTTAGRSVHGIGVTGTGALGLVMP